MAEFANLPLEQLAPSPTNPRKTFDDVKLDELARSIGQHGILEPILVRRDPDPEPPVVYEVVAGERRYRAATIAEVETVPCIVRELTDREVLEIQVIENLQRDDLHPLEEAEGYSALVKQAGYDVEKIAERIGRSKKYVYDRVKLLELVPELRGPFLEGEITAGHAILLARLSPDDQKRALGPHAHQSGVFAHEHADSTLFEEGQEHRKAKSVRELQTWIDHNVRFKPDEVDLPNLFPETAAQLQVAEEEELDVVKITREYRVPDAAKASGERTYGSAHWKRADGAPWRPDAWKPEVKSKPCDHSRMGVVVAGPGRGESFLVCVDKKKCTVHWREWQKESAARKASAGDQASANERARAEDRKRQERWQAERIERERWQKARPALAAAIQKAALEAKPTALIDQILKWILSGGKLPAGLKTPTTVDDAVRVMGVLVLQDIACDSWRAAQDAPKALKVLGLDAKAIVAEANGDASAKKAAPKKNPAKKKAPAKKRAAKKPAKKKPRPKKKSADVSTSPTEPASEVENG